jgi:hypothetical protein
MKAVPAHEADQLRSILRHARIPTQRAAEFRPQARPTVDEVVRVTETTGAAGGVVSTGSVTVTVLLFADSRPFASPAHMTNEYVLPGTMSRVQV